jgi:hypothetical protein
VARFKCTLQAVPRNYHGQQFMDYWFLGKQWSGASPTEVELEEEELKSVQAHEKAGYPIRVLSVVEADVPKPPDPPAQATSTLPATSSTPTPTPTPAKVTESRPPWAPPV